MKELVSPVVYCEWLNVLRQVIPDTDSVTFANLKLGLASACADDIRLITALLQEALLERTELSDKLAQKVPYGLYGLLGALSETLAVSDVRNKATGPIDLKTFKNLPSVNEFVLSRVQFAFLGVSGESQNDDVVSKSTIITPDTTVREIDALLEKSGVGVSIASVIECLIGAQ